MNQALPRQQSMLWSAPAYLAGIMSAAGTAGFRGMRGAHGPWALGLLGHAPGLCSAIVVGRAGPGRRQPAAQGPARLVCGLRAWPRFAGPVWPLIPACASARYWMPPGRACLQWATPVLLAMGSVAGALFGPAGRPGVRSDSILAGLPDAADRPERGAPGPHRGRDQTPPDARTSWPPWPCARPAGSPPDRWP